LESSLRLGHSEEDLKADVTPSVNEGSVEIFPIVCKVNSQAAADSIHDEDVSSDAVKGQF